MSHSITQVVYDFFLQVRDSRVQVKEELSRLRLEDIWLEEGKLVFSLPALHKFLFCEKACGYSKFRRELYGSSLNSKLREIGAKVIIFESTGKIDTSRYCLLF